MIEIDHEIRVRSRFGPLKVKVTSSAIMAMRKNGSKSLPAYVIAEQRELIDAIAIRKYAAGELDVDGCVLISERDVT